jgi:hypothetical protein
MGEMKNAYKIFGRGEGGDNTEDVGVDGRIILKWILRKQIRRAGTRLIWFRIGIVGWAIMNRVMNLQLL